MIRKKNDKGEWLEFSLLQNFPNVVHGVLLKGCLEADFLDYSGIPSSISSHQVHGSVVKDIEGLVLDPKSDGLFTRQSNIALSIRHADCQAAIFYDPIQNAIANIHCGWRGNVQNIYGKAIQTMKDTLGSKAEDLIICISPSLGPDHAEFLNFEDEFPFDFWPFQVRPCYFDLWQISRNQLEEAGVRSKNIEIAQICTYDNPSEFYSYRLDKTAHRNHTLVALR